MIGARWLAAERGAFDVEPMLEHVLDPPDAPTHAVARAPLYEVAATHDGQPPITWLQMFMGLWKA
jgi:hypothetical protein